MLPNAERSRAAAWRSVAQLPRPFKAPFYLPFGVMADGSEASFPVNVIAGSMPRPVVVAVAGHHGDEGEGPAALVETWRVLEPENITGTLILIPVLNPPAFRLGRRRGPDDDLDINRIFPGNPNGTTTSRIADAFIERVAPDVDFILSMHGWSAGYGLTPYSEYPVMTTVTPRSREAALSFGLPYLNPIDAGPGRLLTEASKLGVPIIETEIGGQGVSIDSERARYETGLMRLLIHLGVTSGSLSPTPQPVYVERVDCHAPREGILRPMVSLGASVTNSQPLASVHDMTLNYAEIIRAPCDGLVGILRLAANVGLGHLVASIFHPIAEPTDTGPLRDESFPVGATGKG